MSRAADRRLTYSRALMWVASTLCGKASDCEKAALEAARNGLSKAEVSLYREEARIFAALAEMVNHEWARVIPRSEVRQLEKIAAMLNAAGVDISPKAPRRRGTRGRRRDDDEAERYEGGR